MCCVNKVWASFAKEQKSFVLIRSFHSIHYVVDRGVPHSLWEELVGEAGVGHYDPRSTHYLLTTPI